QNRQLARLHMILKPFMLRRVKKDVENEMPPKIEILVDCILSQRQRWYYRYLQQKLHIHKALANNITTSLGDKNDSRYMLENSDNLMNIVMQFRKLLNHPSLFHPRQVLSSYLFS